MLKAMLLKLVSSKTRLLIVIFIAVLLSVFSYGVVHLYKIYNASPITFWQSANQQSKQTIEHSAWQQILSKYVKYSNALSTTVFDYQAVTKQDKKQLENYLTNMQKLDPRDFNRNEQFAYWVNLYNALTVNLVLEHYPIESIKDIHQLPINAIGNIIGPWDIPLANVAGQELTLNKIEHGILRANWQDPRVHYVLNCASRGCPDLPMQALNSQTLERQLNQAAQTFINQPRAVSIESDGVMLSSIYNWFAKDFGHNQQSLIKHLKQYANPTLAKQLDNFDGEINYQYNWQLNQPLSDESVNKEGSSNHD